MASSATIVCKVGKLSWRELWRLGKGPFGFALLCPAKLFGRSHLDKTLTIRFAPEWIPVSEIPAHLAGKFADDRIRFERAGFSLLGIDRQLAEVGGCGAYFLRGAIVGNSTITKSRHTAAFYSFPEGAKPVATTNGYSAFDLRPLFDSELLPRATMADLLARHAERISALSLPELSPTIANARLEEMTVRAYEFHLARGVYVPAPADILPPPLSTVR